MRKNLEKVVNLFLPDVDGYSDWVTVQEVINYGLNWSNNGNVRRGTVFGVTEYKWKFYREGKNKIIKMKLNGYNEKLVLNQKIRKDIVESLMKKSYSNFSPDCIIPLIKEDKEIDHRWGRKDHHKYQYLNDISKQSIDDFQLLSHSHNQFKREQCIKCKKTNLRFSPPNEQQFKIGCQKWEDEIGCSGCPLAEPELYR